MKKWLLFLAIAIAASIFLFLQTQRGSGPVGMGEGASSSSAPTMRLASVTLPQFGGRTPREVASNYLEAHREEWKIQDHHELVPEISRYPLGARVRYQVFQNGIPVVGLGIDISMDENLNVVDVDNGYRPLEEADLNGPKLSPAEIMAEATQHYQYEPDGKAEMSESSRILFASEAMTKPELAVVVPLLRGKDSYQVVFRASDGQFLGRTKSRSEF